MKPTSAAENRNIRNWKVSHFMKAECDAGILLKEE
jgi:hypothetical protein